MTNSSDKVTVAVLGRRERNVTVSREIGARPASLPRLTDTPDEGARTTRRPPHPLARPTNVGDRIFRSVTTGFAGLIVLVLFAMLAILVYNGWQSLMTFGITFVTTSTWDPVHNIFGALPAILGTLYSSFLALLIAAPVGVMIAVFLTEMSPRRIRFGLGFLIELLSAVPSIVYGLWALFVLVPLVRQYIEPPLIDHFGNTPFFSGYPVGLGMFPAALILSIMVLPTIVALSRDVLAVVPNRQREAMLALGATRWETAWKVVVPYARSGIIGAIMLALARAIGETMAVQMVIGNTQDVSLSLFNLATTMPTTIVNQFTEASAQLYLSALVEMALLLMAVAVVLNAVARVLVWGVTRKYQV